MNTDQLADSTGGRCTGVGRRLDCTNVSANKLLRASHVSSLFIVVEIKVDVRLLAQTYHRKREESRDAHLSDTKV